jgi:hypothetical protein
MDIVLNLKLIDEIDAALRFSIEVEGKLSMDDIENYDEVFIILLTSRFALKSYKSLRLSEMSRFVTRLH